MGRASSDVVVRFIGDTGNLAKGMDNLQGRFVGVATSLKGIAQAGAVVGAISFFKGAIGEAREAERVTRKTQAVLKSTGQVAGVTANHVADLSGRMSELAGVDDEVIQQGNNVLLTFTKVRNEVGNGNDVFDQAAKVSLDMAAALDKTGDSGAAMQEQALRIGKALNDPIRGMTALTKVGVTFSQAQKDQVKALVESGDMLGAQKIILRELQTEFGGMAQASADAVDKGLVSWGNFAEDMGKKVLPAVNAVSNWALQTGIPALGQVADTVGDVVEPAFDGLVSTGRGLVGMWEGLPEPIQAGAIAMGAWMAVGGRVEGFFGRAGGPVKAFGQDVKVAMGAFDVNRVTGAFMAMEERVPALAQMGTAFRTARGDVDGFGSALRGVGAAGISGLKSAAGGLMGVLGGPWGLALAGATVLLSAISGASDKAAAEQQQLADAGKSVARALAEQNGVITEGVRRKAAQAAEDSNLLKGAERFNISTSRVTDAILGQRGALESVSGQLDYYIEQGSSIEDGVVVYDQTAVAAIRLQENLHKVVEEKGTDLDAQNRVNEAARTYQDVVTGTGTAAAGAMTSTELYKAAVDAAGIELEEGGNAADHMREAIDRLTQAETMQMDTLEGYEAAQDALDAAIQQNGTTLDIHTEKGRANRDALEELAQKSRDLMQADIDAGVPAAEALARHDARIQKLHDEATATFGANSEANTLIDTYGRVPKEVRTAYETEGYEAVKAQLDRLSAGQFLLSQGIPMTPANVRAVQQERRNRFAEGGPVRGPGTPTSDSIPAYLSNREFVQNAAATDYYGVPFMNALNQKRIPRDALPGYAGGGVVVPMKVDVSKTKIPNPAAFPGGASLGALQGFARAQAGKRYQWGATGPNTWDCSGLVGAIWALAHGKNPYQRYMTTASMGPGRYGMKSGRGPVTVYLGPGHTAANIGGLHAEAYGGNGTPVAVGRIGTPLSYYNQVMHLARGGLARLKNDPAARQESFLNSGWPEPGRVGMFKNGGWLQPGQFAYNETGRPEPVLNQQQWDAVNGGGTTIILQTGPIGSQMQLEDWLTKSLDNLKRKGRLPK